MWTALAGAQGGAPATGVGSAFELTFWQSVAASDDRDQIAAYLAQYPNGTFSALARAKITALDRREGRGPAASPPASPAVVPSVPPAPPPVPPTAPMVVPAASAVIPPAPEAVLPTPPVAAPVPAATQPPATPMAASPEMTDLLHQLGSSQAQASAAAAVTEAAGPALPPRPQMAAVPPVDLPPAFCSAADRNAYYDSVYRPAKEAADANNRLAVDYLQTLKSVYDGLAAHDDRPAMNRVSAAATDYGSVAREAYATSLRYEGKFAAMMAVPIQPCGKGQGQP